MTVDISSEAFERLAKDCDRAQRDHDQWTREAHLHFDAAATLRAQAERIKELEAENTSLRAVLDGAEYREIDAIAKQDPDMCRMLGMAVASLTKSEIAKKRNDALREAAEIIGRYDEESTCPSCCDVTAINEEVTALIEGATND